MTVIGTGIAAGVAATAQQAERVARRRDKRAHQASGDAERVREMIESHMRALEEGDEATLNSVTQLHIDAELPQHQSPAPPNTQANDADTHRVSQSQVDKTQVDQRRVDQVILEDPDRPEQDQAAMRAQSRPSVDTLDTLAQVANQANRASQVGMTLTPPAGTDTDPDGGPLYQHVDIKA